MINKDFLEEVIKKALPEVNYLIDEKKQVAEIYVAVGVRISITNTDKRDFFAAPFVMKAPGQQLAITMELSTDKKFLVKLLRSTATASEEYLRRQQWISLRLNK
ncbi:hypothetical protein [Saccharicrinis sp. GN24d3]|uniref:hypothetical protein n=1 Tax=Saccharicrinis sp. GN24d3 TaxID=3458416 RepID=UPI004036DB2F